MNPSPTSSNVPIRRISATEAASSAASCLLLDVRTPAEFEDAHIEGSVLHPLPDLDPKVVKSTAAGKQGCVLICRSGGRASQAAEKLAAAGLTPLLVLEGGVSAWEKAGLPLIHGRKTISLERQVRIAAGFLVFTGTVLAFFWHPGWLALPAFVGSGLMFAGITDWCGMGLLLARMPWNR